MTVPFKVPKIIEDELALGKIFHAKVIHKFSQNDAVGTACGK